MEDLFICDAHNDFLTELSFEKIQDYIQNCGKEGVLKLSSSFWTTEMDKNYILNELPRRASLIDNDKTLLHIEDLWWVENEKDLKFLKEIKPFSCSLTWNNVNALASGSKAEGGLTKWGRRVVDVLQDEGIIIDLAHLNRKSFFEVANIIKNNLYCSHTGFSQVKIHKRNLTEKQIDMIVNSNGFIGLFFYDKAIKCSEREFSAKDIVQNIKFFTSQWEYDNIGIGSDFYGIDNYPKDIKNYSDFKNLKYDMLGEGFSENQIDKIFYKNFLNFTSKFNLKHNIPYDGK